MWEQRELNTEFLEEIKKKVENLALEALKNDVSKIEKIIEILRTVNGVDTSKSE